MYLISTGKTTVLTYFNNLNTKSIYHHSNGESTDFQFYAQQRLFVEVNKKSGLEIMRIKEKEDSSLDIQRVRKLTIDNVYCVACAKQSLEEMAMGLANGQVKLYNYKSTEFVHRFSAENIRNSVLYLDYNASDEYIASVFESGQINIYGIKTKTKIETINIDSNSTLARFHPTKRFHLSIASYKGAVTTYDVQSKRKLFNASDAHAAPCRDLCMSRASADTLISVGYDCLINIFDTRQKVKSLQLNHCHPLSTVAISDCGTYFCVGNLKGELTTYDIRDTKVCLCSRKVHDSAVTRIGFVPTSGGGGGDGGGRASFSSSGNLTVEQTTTTSGNELRRSITPNTQNPSFNTRTHHDSFCDFLDFQANRGQEKMSSRYTMRRDSFDWEALTRKPSSDDNRLSLLNRRSSVTASISGNDSFDGKSNISESSHVVITGPLRDRSNTPSLTPQTCGKLTQIEEEKPPNQPELSRNCSSGSDKENPVIELDFVGSHLGILPADRNSTPNRERISLDGVLEAKKPESGNTSDLHKEISDLRQEMLSRFHHLETEMKFIAETNKWQIFTQSSNLWCRQIDSTEEIRDALAILLQTDPFVNEFLRLKEENEQLKNQLQQLMKK